MLLPAAPSYTIQSIDLNQNSSDMFPYDEAVVEWISEIFIYSWMSENQKLQKWKVKTI